MTTTHSLELAIELARRARDDAARGVAQAVRTHAHAENLRLQLESYSAETDARWISSAQNATSTDLMRHHYLFIGRLDQAIEMQRAQAKTTLAQAELARKKLLTCQHRLAALKQVLTKKQSEFAKLREKRDQHLTDELAARNYVRAWAGSERGERQ